MEINKSKVNDMTIKLTVNLNKEDFAVYLDKAFEVVVKTVKVDGFRPGKMPKKMFISRYGYEALYEEAIHQAINHTYPQIIEQEKVMALDMPTIDFDSAAVSAEDGFSYTAQVYVIPEIKNLNYKGLSIEVPNTIVSDQEIQARITKDLERLIEVVEKVGQAEMGDDVVFDFEGFLNGEPFEGGKAENYTLTLGSNQFIPGFEEQLVGISAGSDADINVTFPEQYGHEALAGQDVVFKCHIHEVKTKVVPTLVDAIVADLEIEGVTTVDQYKDSIVNEIQQRKNKEQEDAFINKTFDVIYENSGFKLEEAFIEHKTTERIDDIKKTIKEKYKIEYEMYLQLVGQTTETFENHQRLEMTSYFRDYFITQQIIADEKFNPSKEEIDQMIAEIAEQQKIKQEEVLRQYPLEQLVFSSLSRKVLALLSEANTKVIA